MNKIKPNPFTKYRRLFIASGIFIFIILAILFLASLVVEHKIKSALEEIVDLKYENLSVSWHCREMSLYNISYLPSPDSSVITCGALNVSGLSMWHFVKNDRIVIKDLIVKDLDVKILDQFFRSNGNGESEQMKYPLSIEKFRFENIMLDYKKSDGSHLKSENIKGEINYFEMPVDSNAASINFKSIILNTAKGSFKKTGTLYSVFWESIDLNDNQGALSLNNLELLPLPSKENWTDQVGEKKARLHLKTPLIALRGFNPAVFWNEKIFYADSLIINKASLDIFTDETAELCQDCYKSLIHEQLYKAKIPITLAKAIIKNCNINIEVLGKATRKKGKISFENIYASIYDIDNTKRKTNHKIHADVQSQFMGKRQLDVSFDFFMQAPAFDYTFEATIEDLDLVNMNSFSIPTKNTRIESGQLHHLSFQAKGNNTVAQGTMQFEYKDLKIILIGKKTGKTKKLLSGIVNSMGIKNNNMPGDKHYTEGKMYYLRTTNGSIFHQWSYAIQSGFKSILFPDIILSGKLK